MPFHYSIESVEFSGGSRVELARDGITLIVGPNNVGKSRSLKEIAVAIGVGHPGGTAPVATKNIRERREGSDSDFNNWLDAKYEFSDTGNGGVFSGRGIRLAFNGMNRAQWSGAFWPHAPAAYRTFGRVYASFLDTETRLRTANAVKAHDSLQGSGPEALHALYENSDLEDSVSGVFRKVFGLDLVVDRLGGGQVSLRVGRRPVEAEVGERMSVPYGRAVRALVPLDDQGDGVRSYVACLIHTDILERPVLLIDEPETFLPPPPARLLAQHLASSAKAKGMQIVAATHSSEIVRGALDVSGVPVSVVRLTRDERGNHARQLAAADVQKLWADPLLRASNLLDALFHERLVLCEADGDCRFYNAVLEAVCDVAKTSRPNVMFSQTGGKHRLHVAASALVALGVPVTVVADLDVLSDVQPLRGIWEALGHDWSTIEPLFRSVKAAVDVTAKKPERERVRERFIEVIDEINESKLDGKAVDSLRGIFRAEGGWAQIKRDGVDAFPKGHARQQADQLIQLLVAGGLHVVPVGEIEGFVPTIGGHGPSWVVEALQRDLAKDAELERARAFIRSLGLIATSSPSASGYLDLVRA